jgi:hypothetical protein
VDNVNRERCIFNNIRCGEKNVGPTGGYRLGLRFFAAARVTYYLRRHVVSVWHNELSARHTVDILMHKIIAAHGFLYLLAAFIVVALHHYWSASIAYASASLRAPASVVAIFRRRSRAHPAGVHAGLRAKRESRRCSGRCKSISISASDVATVAMQPPEYSVV